MGVGRASACLRLTEFTAGARTANDAQLRTCGGGVRHAPRSGDPARIGDVSWRRLRAAGSMLDSTLPDWRQRPTCHSALGRRSENAVAKTSHSRTVDCRH